MYSKNFMNIIGAVEVFNDLVMKCEQYGLVLDDIDYIEEVNKNTKLEEVFEKMSLMCLQLIDKVSNHEEYTLLVHEIEDEAFFEDL